MNSTSPVVTGTATAAMTIVVPIISWLAELAHVAIPPNVQLSIAVVLVTGAHVIGRSLSRRFAQP